MSEKIRYYEVSYLLNPALQPDQTTAAENDLRAILGTHGAVIDSYDSPRIKTLAYPIKEQTEAYAGAFRFYGPRDDANAIRDELKKKSDIIRSMLLEWKKAPERKKQPTLLPFKKEEKRAAAKALDQTLEEILGETLNESK